jgi:predicted MFS family arabinose efflux permease
MIDRVNKKRFLIRNMVLLAVLTFLSTLMTHFGALLALRFCAGLVGGTTMGMGMSILINCTPLNLRGKMLATVIAHFRWSVLSACQRSYFCARTMAGIARCG